MRHGFILSFSLYILLFISLFVSIKYTQTEQLQKLTQESEMMYNHLSAEHIILDEILFRRSLLMDEDFDFSTHDFNYSVAFNDNDVKITVTGLQQYEISLK